jgi:ribosomal protein S18 acetylase RimI-like enzyme
MKMQADIAIKSGFVETWDLWRSTLGETWDIDRNVYRDVLRSKFHLSAYQDERLIGSVVYDCNSAQRLGSISLIVVAPEYRRHRIGSRLLTEVKQKLAGLGVEKILLCDCGLKGLWRALPKNIDGAADFFTANGWDMNLESLDQIGNIKGYKSPEFLNIRPRRQDLAFRFFEPRDTSELLDFQQRNFPQWRIYFQRFIEQGHFENIVVAFIGNELIASCLLEYPGQKFMGSNWVNMLGAACGSPSVLGVSAQYRGYGIGYYLFDHAMSTLAARGAKHAFINESDAPGVYKRFGFEVIFEYWQGACVLQ